MILQITFESKALRAHVARVHLTRLLCPGFPFPLPPTRRLVVDFQRDVPQYRVGDRQIARSRWSLVPVARLVTAQVALEGEGVPANIATIRPRVVRSFITDWFRELFRPRCGRARLVGFGSFRAPSDRFWNNGERERNVRARWLFRPVCFGPF